MHSRPRTTRRAYRGTAHCGSAHRGFTILELLTVIVMVGLISTISVSQIHSVMLKERVQRAATSLDNTIEAAFALATRNRQPVTMSWSSSSMQFSVTDRTGNTAFRNVSLAPAASGLASGSVTFSDAAVTIYPNGLAGDTLLVTISSTAETKYVKVSRAGLVQIQ